MSVPPLLWLRANLSLTIFLFGLFSSGTGALVNATARITAFENRLAQIEHDGVEQAERINRLEGERHERDAQLVKTAADLSVVNQRLAVLESQIRWIGDRLEAIGGKRPR